MKKKVALLLAAVLAVTGTGQASLVSGAEFTDAEIVEEFLPGDMEIPEDDVSEEADDFEDIGSEEILFEEPLTELPVLDEDAFDDGEAAPAMAEEESKVSYSGGYVSKADFERWEKDFSEPDGYANTEVEAASPDEFFKALKGTNTGYCIMTFDEVAGGYVDFKAPDGLKVGIAAGGCPKLKSISSDSGVTIQAHVETPGELKISGNGTLALNSCRVNGVLVGEGKNDTVMFDGWTSISGIQRVENTVFTDSGIRILGGPSEFYNITGPKNGNVYVTVQGYSEKIVPVFHKKYTKNLDIEYVESIEGDDWKTIDPGAGKYAVKFEGMSDSDIIAMLKNLTTAKYSIDMNGKTYLCDDKSYEKMFNIIALKTYKNTSAKKAFESEGFDPVPEKCRVHIGQMPDMSQAVRAVQAYEKSGSGEGYYSIYLGRGVSIDKISVPENIKGLACSAWIDWDEKTQKADTVPIKLSGIDVPKGKVCKLFYAKTNSGKLTITGEGQAEFYSCRLNQDIAGKSVRLQYTNVKSLKCDTLYAEDSVFVVSDFLSFKQGGLKCSLLAKSGAKIELGAINNKKYLGIDEGYLQIFLENNGSKRPALHFASSELNIGNIKIEETGETFPATLGITPYDYKKASAKGAPFVKDCFDYNYEMFNEKNIYPWDFKASLKDTDAIRLATMDEVAAAEFPWGSLIFEYASNKFVQVRKAFPGMFGSREYVTSDGKYLTTYGTMSGFAKPKAYIQTTKAANPLPAKGKNFKVGDLKYKITKSSATSGTVAVYGAASKYCTSVSIPSSVKINGYTFKVTEIYTNAFKNYSKLKKVTIGSYVEKVGKYAFYGCKYLKDITIKSTRITYMGSYALKGIYSKAVIKVPYNRVKTYTRLFADKGQSKYVKITK